MEAVGVGSSTKRKRLIKAGRLALLLGAPVVAAVVFGVVGLSQTGRDMADSAQLRHSLASAEGLRRLVTEMQKERGMTCVYLSSDAASKEAVMEKLRGHRLATDEALAATDAAAWSLSGLGSQQWFENDLFEYREMVGDRVTRCQHVLEWYTANNERLLSQVAALFKTTQQGSFWSDICGFNTLLSAIDKIGVKRALGGAFFASGSFSKNESISFALLSGASSSELEASLQAASKAEAHYKQQTVDQSALMSTLNTMESEVLRNERDAADSNRGLAWFDHMTVYMEILFQVERQLYTELADAVSAGHEAQLLRLIGLAVVALAAVMLMGVSLAWLVRSDKRAVAPAAEAPAAALGGQQVPAGLLPLVAVKPRTWDEATVCYTDVAGFAQLTIEFSANEVVELLNALYKRYDKILEDYDCVKVESVGDVCLLAAGLDDRKATAHSEQMCTLALCLLRMASAFHIGSRPAEALLMRFGVATGKVSSGLVKAGRVVTFGPCVNEAAHLLAACRPLHISVAESTRKHLNQHHDGLFAFVPIETDEMRVSGHQVGPKGEYWLIQKEGLQFKADLKQADEKAKTTIYWQMSAHH